MSPQLTWRQSLWSETLDGRYDVAIMLIVGLFRRRVSDADSAAVLK